MDYYHTDTDVNDTLFKLFLYLSLLYTDTDGFSTRDKILNFFCATNHYTDAARAREIPFANHLHSIAASIP